MVSGSPAASPDSSDNSDTQHSGGSDMEMDDQMMTGSKRNQQRLSDTEVYSTYGDTINSKKPRSIGRAGVLPM